MFLILQLLPSSIPFYNQRQRFFELIPSTFKLGSSTVTFVGTEVAVRDLFGLQSTAELCQPGTAADFVDGVLLSCDLSTNLIVFLPNLHFGVSRSEPASLFPFYLVVISPF